VFAIRCLLVSICIIRIDDLNLLYIFFFFEISLNR